MNILFLGDIVGRSGREKVIEKLDNIKKEFDIDLTIANGENAAHGKGITYRVYNQLISAGIDVITMGNHAFSKSEIIDHLDEMDKLVLPINHYLNEYKHYFYVIKVNNLNICITNIMGVALMNDQASNPYDAMKKIFEYTRDLNIDLYLVDFHGETTSEKRLFAEYFKEDIDILIGTHTHVQTADEQFIGDLAFISDVGMCGPYQSIIGRDIDELINMIDTNEKGRYTVSEAEAILSAVIIEIDEDIKKAVNIKRLQIRP